MHAEVGLLIVGGGGNFQRKSVEIVTARRTNFSRARKGREARELRVSLCSSSSDSCCVKWAGAGPVDWWRENYSAAKSGSCLAGRGGNFYLWEISHANSVTTVDQLRCGINTPH